MGPTLSDIIPSPSGSFFICSLKNVILIQTSIPAIYKFPEQAGSPEKYLENHCLNTDIERTKMEKLVPAIAFFQFPRTNA
jgi:hypothetical protein